MSFLVPFWFFREAVVAGLPVHLVGQVIVACAQDGARRLVRRPGYSLSCPVLHVTEHEHEGPSAEIVSGQITRVIGSRRGVEW